MLLVDASAGPSAIHGTGLMARSPIPAGTLIWEFRPGFDVSMNAEQWQALSDPARQQVRRYVYEDLSTGQFILCSDDARYMNHAVPANTTTRGFCTWTTRDVAPGEELTADYREFDRPSRERG